MFGLGLPFLSYFRRQIGLRNDAASGTGTLHAKTALLGQSNPTNPDETRVMNFLLKLKYMSGAVNASATIRKTLSGNVNVTAGSYDSYNSRYTQSATVTVCSFVAGVTGRIRVIADVKNYEIYGSGSYRYDYQYYTSGYTNPGLQAKVNGTAVTSARIGTNIKDYNPRTINLNFSVRLGDIVAIEVFSGYYSWQSCGSTYYAYNGGNAQNIRVGFDYDDTGIIQF